jgi:hypothetical protein
MAAPTTAATREVTFKLYNHVVTDAVQRAEVWIDGERIETAEHKPHLDALSDLLVFLNGYLRGQPFTMNVEREWLNGDGEVVSTYKRERQNRKS